MQRPLNFSEVGQPVALRPVAKTFAWKQLQATVDCNAVNGVEKEL